jgi:hypothetical protein
MAIKLWRRFEMVKEFDLVMSGGLVVLPIGAERLDSGVRGGRIAAASAFTEKLLQR